MGGVPLTLDRDWKPKSYIENKKGFQRLLCQSFSRWWFQIFLFSPLLGEMIQLDEYFSIGLKPPTSFQILLLSPDFARRCRQFLWTAGTKMITRLAAFLGGLRRVRCNFNMTVLFFEGHIFYAQNPTGVDS